MKFGICRICGSGCESNGKRSYCSEACISEAKKKNYSCRGCQPNNLKFREVFFKDGTRHIQRYCLSCLKAQFVHEEGWMNVERQEEPDFLTNAARDYARLD